MLSASGKPLAEKPPSHPQADAAMNPAQDIDLNDKLAEHGFVSDQDFTYPLRCFFNASSNHLNCLHVDGLPGRHKTAFAYALAKALDYPDMIYHEAQSLSHVPLPKVKVNVNTDEDEEGEAPIPLLEQDISEACAKSEANPTVLILDQLHLIPFRDQLRLQAFLQSGQWNFQDTILCASESNLLVLLITEEPLFHALKQQSFSLWIDEDAPQAFSADDLDLPEAADELLQHLATVFIALEVQPKKREYQNLIHDIHVHVNTPQELMTSIYGWIEGISRERLFDEAMRPHINQAFSTIRDYLNLESI